eukprot:Hpha_TRINITY_DN16271_c3_g5::TRINITY_DN16271_c3_g5_i4::g.13609::m.13609
MTLCIVAFRMGVLPGIRPRPRGGGRQSSGVLGRDGGTVRPLQLLFIINNPLGEVDNLRDGSTLSSARHPLCDLISAFVVGGVLLPYRVENVFHQLLAVLRGAYDGAPLVCLHRHVVLEGRFHAERRRSLQGLQVHPRLIDTAPELAREESQFVLHVLKLVDLLAKLLILLLKLPERRGLIDQCVKPGRRNGKERRRENLHPTRLRNPSDQQYQNEETSHRRGDAQSHGHSDPAAVVPIAQTHEPGGLDLWLRRTGWHEKLLVFLLQHWCGLRIRQTSTFFAGRRGLGISRDGVAAPVSHFFLRHNCTCHFHSAPFCPFLFACSLRSPPAIGVGGAGLGGFHTHAD